ncbi:MAG TPA: hypothetical protein VFT74_21660 [Isosphaeraceae bacterium]|nr:hypothetical protein [Isosphaeraceae bacterium]
MHDEHDHSHEHEHEHPHHDHEHEAIELELDTQSRIFLQMREQNVELLKVAADVAGYGKANAPMRPDEVRHALQRIWDIYSEFYEWVDPEESEEDEGS